MTGTGTAHGRLAWFEIHVDDLDRAADFYGAVLGWTFRPLPDFAPGGYLLIETKSGELGNGGLLRNGDRPRPNTLSSVLYFEVVDIHAAVDAAVACGGQVHQHHTYIGGEHGYYAIIRDPEGNDVGLWADH
jgi:uncharacterized protein